MVRDNSTQGERVWQGDLLHSEAEAHAARLALATRGVYPTRPMAAEHDGPYEEAIRGELLPETLARLTRDDVVSIYWLSRLLATYPPRPALFGEIATLERALLEALVSRGAISADVLK